MQSNILGNLSVKQLRQAITIRSSIERLQRQLQRLNGVPEMPTRLGRRRGTRRSMSAAARAKISAAAKARWKAYRAKEAGK